MDYLEKTICGECEGDLVKVKDNSHTFTCIQEKCGIPDAECRLCASLYVSCPNCKFFDDVSSFRCSRGLVNRKWKCTFCNTVVNIDHLYD
jgi:hypothetical protein